jgi:hypothetical protein
VTTIYFNRATGRVYLSSMNRTCLLAFGASLGLAAVPAVAADQPVVVELFTSQGCSSCPPADAYLGELAKQPDLVALGFHVDYWDYIGWKDPFATPSSTARQRGYAERLSTRYLYTPEMVVDGQSDATGSDREAVDGLIAQARRAPKIALAVSETGADHYRVALPAAAFNGTATLWMAIFDARDETEVARGENEGHKARDYNAVRALRQVGHWTGQAETLDVAGEPGMKQGCAFLLQSDIKAGDGQGIILGAALAAPPGE